MAQQDINHAKSTYAGFVSLLKWSAIITAVIVAFIILMIS